MVHARTVQTVAVKYFMCALKPETVIHASTRRSAISAACPHDNTGRVSHFLVQEKHHIKHVAVGPHHRRAQHRAKLHIVFFYKEIESVVYKNT
jgi:hypothetical protein